MSRPLALVALVLACGSPEPPQETPASGEEAPVESDAPAAPTLSTVTFSGAIELQPEAVFSPSRGTVRLHVFALDGTPFDLLACYGEPDHCTVLELHATGDPRRWTAHVAQSEAASAPVDLSFELDDGDWLEAGQVQIHVHLSEGVEAGTATLVRAPDESPPAGLRERRRAEGRLRAAFETIATDFHRASMEERRLPTALPLPLARPPCVPQRVSDAEALAWLGLTAPIVLSWSYAIETEGDTLRLIALRDPACDGALEEVTLEAGVDEYGDLELRP